jgi:hypothetical protein
MNISGHRFELEAPGIFPDRLKLEASRIFPGHSFELEVSRIFPDTDLNLRLHEYCRT